MSKRGALRRVPVILLAMLIVLAAAGCAGPRPGKEQEAKKQITVLYIGDPPWQQQAVEFTKATGIEVKYESVPFPQLHDKMLAAFVAGSSDYDVVHVRDDWVAEFASKGFLLSLDDRITADMKARIPQRAFEALSYGGHVYGVPRYLWLWQFYYNKKMFEEAGIKEPPQTWSDVERVAALLTKGDQYGYCEAWGKTFAYTPFLVHLRAEGGQFWDYTGNRPAFSSPEGVKALQTMIKLKKYMPKTTTELTGTGPLADLFTQGKIGMIMCTPHTYPMANDPTKSRIVGQVGVALIPGALVKTSSYGETGGVGIPAASKNPDMAWEYVKFVTSTEQQKEIAMSLGRVPSDVNALRDAEVQTKYPHFALVPDQTAYPYGMFVHPKATQIGDIVSRHILRALSGEVAPERALRDAEEEVVKAIGTP